MKNVKKAIALVAVILGVSTMSFAQNGFSIHAGGNFPMGTFGKGGSLSDIALNNAVAEVGGAATGFNAGLKYQFRLVSHLNAFVSADFFYNGLKSELTEGIEVEGVETSAPSYMNIPAMVGLNYSVLKVLGSTIWAEVGAGINFRNITGSNVNAAWDNLVWGREAEYKLSTSLGWQAGAGISLDDKVSISLHYYSLGSAGVDGESSFSSELEDIISGETKPIEFSKGKLSPSMVVVRLGYHF